jgi:hypothetical protein
VKTEEGSWEISTGEFAVTLKEKNPGEFEE